MLKSRVADPAAMCGQCRPGWQGFQMQAAAEPLTLAAASSEPHSIQRLQVCPLKLAESRRPYGTGKTLFSCQVALSVRTAC